MTDIRDTSEETAGPQSDADPDLTDEAGVTSTRGLDLMSVLVPATPPVPRNARLVAGMGISKAAPPPRELKRVVMAAPRQARKADRRRPARAARNASLWIAAGLK